MTPRPYPTDRQRARRAWLALPLAMGLAGLPACTGPRVLTAEVSTFGEWPAGRAPGLYAFDRLPSQQARVGEMQLLEAAAAAALDKAGFKPAAAGAQPDVLVQVGVRTTQVGRPPWDDPLWWHGGFGYWRHGPWRGGGWSFGLRTEVPRYDREAGLLIRDRASGKPLYEARASHWGVGSGNDALLPALFEAALADFPKTGLSPRSVTVVVAP